jgi:hypothetical protein
MRRGRALGAWLIAIGVCVSPVCGEEALSEYRVKAAFLYKFATYVRWPSRTGVETTAPFVIGVIGKDPFGPDLDAVMKGQNIRGRAIVVKRLAQPEEAARCDVLFIGSSERERLRALLTSLRDTPVLTVGDMDRFAELGGMINLTTTEDNRIRFDINKGAIDRAGLKVASSLLGLARIVQGEEMR